jgi:preprotein translocase subunit SecF
LPKAASLQKIDDGEALMIRLPLDASKTNEEVVASLKAVLAKNVAGEIEYRKVDYVGPQVGAELIETAIIALLAAFGVLMVYVWVRFEWQYALGALFSLLHDTVLVVGFFLVTQIEFDLTAVAAILTVVGYSINDTVVVYDRVRENLRKYKKLELADLIDLSVNETMSRTILTAGTTMLALACLIIFGGEILKTFSWGMFFGVLIGTYSSVYVAALALLYFDPRQDDEDA